MKFILFPAFAILCHVSCIFAEHTKELLPVITLGSLLSLTGGLEQWCLPIRAGAMLALDEEQARHIKIIFEDDQSLNKTATLAAAKKLLHINKVQILSSWTNSAVHVLTPLAKRSSVPLLIGAYDNRVVESGPPVFGAFVNFLKTPEEIAEFLIQKKGARRLALLTLADDWSLSFAAPYKKAIESLGAELVFEETLSSTDTSTGAIVLRLQQAKADAVLAPLYGAVLYDFLKKAKEMKYQGLIHVGDGMFEEDIKIVGQNAEGIYASQMWLESEELRGKYKKKFGNSATSLQLGLVAIGYDLVMHLAALTEKLAKENKEVTSTSITEELKTFRSQGYLGELHFGEGPKEGGEEMVVVRDGRYVLVEQ